MYNLVIRNLDWPGQPCINFHSVMVFFVNVGIFTTADRVGHPTRERTRGGFSFFAVQEFIFA